MVGTGGARPIARTCNVDDGSGQRRGEARRRSGAVGGDGKELKTGDIT